MKHKHPLTLAGIATAMTVAIGGAVLAQSAPQKTGGAAEERKPLPPGQQEYARGVAFADTMSLSGSDWYIHDDVSDRADADGFSQTDPQRGGWLRATVPGNVQADLESAHLLNPISYGAGDPRLYDVPKKDWWYRKDFVPPASFKDQRSRLIFDGVDHECEVWLNGTMLGRHAGMFRRFGFDVGQVLRPGQKNMLAVRIVRMPADMEPYVTGADGPLIGRGSPYEMHSAFVKMMAVLKDLKSTTNFGWDWGTSIWTLGIWKDVRIEATGPARIEWVHVRAEPEDDHQRASVLARLEIDSLVATKVRAQFRVVGNHADLQAKVEADLRPGSNVIETKMNLDRPALWWPAGQGAQPLYELESRIESLDGRTLLDARRTRFGVRQIRWDKLKDARAGFPEPNKLLVNGRFVRMMGSNLVPPDLLFGRIGQRGAYAMQMAKAAGMNTLRVWGGGVVLPEEMYDWADQLGILLTMSFPFSETGKLPSDDTYLANIEQTTRNIVKQLRNHPSIVEWDPGNGMTRSFKDYPNRHTFDVLKRVLAEESPGTILREMGHDANGPYEYSIDGQDFAHSKRSRSHYQHYDEIQAMRYGEFGCEIPAQLEVWRREIPPSSRWPIQGFEDPVLTRKNAVRAVFADPYWLHKPKIDRMFGPLGSLESMVQAGQFIGAEGMRYAIDALRRKGERIGNFTSWDFNEPWPNAAGSFMLDYDGRPNMMFYAAKQALAPVSLSLKHASILVPKSGDFSASVWLTSDAPEQVSDLKWRWRARTRDGRPCGEGEGAVATIDPQEVKQVGTLDLHHLRAAEEAPVFVELTLLDRSGSVLTERLHVLPAAEVAAPFAGLLGSGPTPVRRTTITASARASSAADEDRLELRIENTGAMTALFCEPHPVLDYRTDIFVENNYAFVPPGESRTFSITARAVNGGLTLSQTGWKVSCWNADAVEIAPDDSLLLSIGRRDQMSQEFGEKAAATNVELAGNRPESSRLPWLLSGSSLPVSFQFQVSSDNAAKRSRLRICTSDQDAKQGPIIEVSINGTRLQKSLPTGLGVQSTQPQHLAFPAAVDFALPAGTWRSGANTLTVAVRNRSWFTWDALQVVAQ